MKKIQKQIPIICLFTILVFIFSPQNHVLTLTSNSYVIVDTGLTICYDNSNSITFPDESDTFYGQDAQYIGNYPSYQENDDGTTTDLNTGLMWQQDPGEKLTYSEALSGADTSTLAGYNDWRLPSIKELYSLINFNGTDPSGIDEEDSLIPFIDTNFFVFQYGDESEGERIIDSQYWSSTEYVSTTMNGDATVFGVNFADGRIKGYPRDTGPGGQPFEMFTLYVRGSDNYGLNDFVDNNNGTITDRASGLMWSKNDSGDGMNWEEALIWVKQKNEEDYLGYNDWRLPNAKEMQSIVDYSRAPGSTNSAAINPIFNISAITDEGGSINYPFFWTSTTHRHVLGGSSAAYVAFGEALGWMQNPITEEYVLLDVHGAGSQRSDPKAGDASDYPYGHGPQGDVIRIDNYVRCVRGGVAEKAESEEDYSKYFTVQETSIAFIFTGIFTIAIFTLLKKSNKKYNVIKHPTDVDDKIDEY